MLKYTDYDIVFQEIPDEVTLAVNLAGCPNRCAGCHSPHLQQDIGEPLTEEALETILGRYGTAVTCLCLMGGDRDPQEIARFALHLRTQHPDLHIGWYSGRTELPADFPAEVLNYVKLGPYIEALGGLEASATNQRLYQIEPDARRTNLTYRFRKGGTR